MKIRVVFDLGPDERRAIANQRGAPGLADYETCKSWLHMVAWHTLQETKSEEDESARAK